MEFNFPIMSEGEALMQAALEKAASERHVAKCKAMSRAEWEAERAASALIRCETFDGGHHLARTRNYHRSWAADVPLDKWIEYWSHPDRHTAILLDQKFYDEIGLPKGHWALDPNGQAPEDKPRGGFEFL